MCQKGAFPFVNNQYFVQRPMNNQTSQLLISLTTYGERLTTVHKTIQSLLNQSKLADKILLWLDEDEFNDSNIPTQLKSLTSKCFEIRYCHNLRSYKKLVPALRAFPDATIITFDDDIIYPSNLVEDLYNECQLSPGSIIASRGRIITLKNGDFAPYASWQYIKNAKKIAAKYCIIPIGYGGVLYPPNSLCDEVVNEHRFMALAPYADDIWFKVMSLLKGTETIILQQDASISMVLIDGTQETALYITHNSGDANTRQIKAIANAFPDIHSLLQLNEFNMVKMTSHYLSDFLNEQELVQFAQANIEAIRDSAIALEKQNIRQSYVLMKLASLLKPHGPKIKRLLQRYTVILAKRDNK
jgi:hypothetical protein